MRKIKVKQKAANGLQDVTVPQAGSYGDVLSSGISMASTGASLGGPWGAAAGAVAGLGMGIIKKDEMDAANKTAKFKNKYLKANRAYSGVDNTIDQSTQVYEDGTKGIAGAKVIEAEDGEVIAKKVGNKFRFVREVKGASHDEGGEPIVAKEGETIYPKKFKARVMQAFKDKNHKTLEALRMMLPKDESPDGEYKDGWRKVSGKWVNNANHGDANSPNTYGHYSDSVGMTAPGGKTPYGQTNPYSTYVSTTPEGSMYAQDPLAPITPKTPTLNTGIADAQPDRGTLATLPTTPVTGAETGAVGGEVAAGGMGANNFLRYANIANNLVRGFQKTPEIQENYVNPDKLIYSDQSEPTRKASRLTARVGASNARNLSGGMGGNTRANMAAGDADNQRRIEGINQMEIGRRDQITNYNTEQQNRANEVNANKRDMYADLGARDKAAQEAHINAATQEVTQLAETQIQDKNLRDLDMQKAKLIGQYGMYSYDANGNYTFNNAGSNPMGNTTETTKTDEQATKTGNTTTRKKVTKKAKPYRR